MANLTSVGVTSGVPSSGTGTVSTIDNLIAVGSPINNGSSSVIANLVGPSSTVTSSMTGLVTAIGYFSSAATLQTVGSISSGNIATVGTVTTVTTVSAVTSLSSGTVAIANGSNVVAVKAAATQASTTDISFVVQESPNSLLSSATGTVADAAYTGSGSASIISALKGIYANVTSAIPGGTNFIGYVTITPATSGGWSKWSTIKNNSSAALTNTVTQIKGSAGTFGGYFIYNANATPATLAVFDSSAAGAVTLGSNRPDLIFEVPATSGANIEFANGINMTNGIQVAALGTVASSSGPASGLDLTILYK